MITPFIYPKKDTNYISIKKHPKAIHTRYTTNPLFSKS